MEEKIDKFLEQKIGWGYLHIGDGVDNCSGTDDEEERQAKKDFKDFILDLLAHQREEIIQALENYDVAGLPVGHANTEFFIGAEYMKEQAQGIVEQLGKKE